MSGQIYNEVYLDRRVLAGIDGSGFVAPSIRTSWGLEQSMENDNMGFSVDSSLLVQGISRIRNQGRMVINFDIEPPETFDRTHDRDPMVNLDNLQGEGVPAVTVILPKNHDSGGIEATVDDKLNKYFWLGVLLCKDTIEERVAKSARERRSQDPLISRQVARYVSYFTAFELPLKLVQHDFHSQSLGLASGIAGFMALRELIGKKPAGRYNSVERLIPLFKSRASELASNYPAISWKFYDEL